MNKCRVPVSSRQPVVLPYSQGQTLVELMITLAVAAILLSVAAPSFTSLRFSNALTNHANEMLGVINFARSEAIRRNIPVRLCRSSTESSNTCVTESGAWQYWIVLANDSVIRRGVIPTHNSLHQSSTLIDDTLTFGADGLARTNNTLVNNHYLQIEAPISSVTENTRRVVLGAGSRINVKKLARQSEES